ncbi:MAG: ChbG/HpnK family deacetylase [Candidatus Daviesbacteria bacterium]|nr:ChbG/HpnK family deacetylase [Candidatus Daviesbacteria bacterium]
MKVILCNDDIGLTYGFTEAIKDTYLMSTSSSTSIRTNGTAYDYTVKLLKSSLKSIGLGIHLNLVDGKAHTSRLANKSGNYKFNFLQYLLLSHNKSVLADIETELDYQFQKVLNDGLKIDHASGHRHTYAIPAIFEIVCKLCKKYRVNSVRLLQEPFYLTTSYPKNMIPFLNFNIIKFLLLNYFSRQNKATLKKYKLTSTDAFYGVLYTDAMNFETVKAALENAKNKGFNSIEILIHPAYPNDPRDKTYTSKLIKKYVHQKTRRIETLASLSKKMKHLLSSPGIKLSTFRDIN